MEQLTQCATATEPVLQSPRAAAAEARVPGAQALQQEQPHCKEMPMPRN